MSFVSSMDNWLSPHFISVISSSFEPPSLDSWALSNVLHACSSWLIPEIRNIFNCTLLFASFVFMTIYYVHLILLYKINMKVLHALDFTIIYTLWLWVLLWQTQAINSKPTKSSSCDSFLRCCFFKLRYSHMNLLKMARDVFFPIASRKYSSHDGTFSKTSCFLQWTL